MVMSEWGKGGVMLIVHSVIDGPVLDLPRSRPYKLDLPGAGLCSG